MLKIHTLGHVHVTQDQQGVQVSAKAAGLLTYLALEKHAYHREHLAELLWDHPQSLRNLRVELARLKQQGLTPFPARQPMLSLHCETDLDLLLREVPQLNELTLPQWLAQLRGTPLSGLEDLGSAAFRDWVDQRRVAINEQVERALVSLHQRFEQEGQSNLSAMIRERAERLELTVPQSGAPVRPTATDLHFTYPYQERELRRILVLARQMPQLVLLNGPPGTKHEMIDDVLRGSTWHAIHIHAAPQRRLVQAALLQQLSHWHAKHHPDQPTDLLRNTDDADADLIRAMQFLSQAGQPVVLAFHNMVAAEEWLANGLRFALDLRMPLLIALCSSSPRVLGDLRQQLGQLDWARHHPMTLPPLGSQGAEQALKQQPAWADRAPDQLTSQAAALAQHTDGWPQYMNVLGRSGDDLIARNARQPEAISQGLLAGLQHFPASMIGGLQRLSQVVDRFDLTLARQLVGDQAQDLLHVAMRAGLLVPASLNEDVHVPSLGSRTNDAETHVGFASELLRVALASRLTSTERHELRCQLAHEYRSSDPALSAMYADRAKLPDIAAEARQRLVAAPAQEPLAPPGRLVAPPPWQDHARQECRTGNGYRVSLENGHLEVMRRGRPGPAPTLTVHFQDVPAGTWRLTARVDVLNSQLDNVRPSTYGLGVQVDGQQRVLYAQQALPTLDCPPPPPCVGLIPLGRWFEVTGHGAGGALALTMRAVNLSVTVGAFEWNGLTLIPPFLDDKDT